jgi:hypothetical protein
MQTERIRQTLSGSLTQDQIEQFQKQGWSPVAIEWERKTTGAERTAVPTAIEDPPFGLRVGSDCLTLEENPKEKEILTTIMELIIQDGPYSSIAQELNRRGFVTRQGSKWSPVAVFEMLPRLVEAGPKILCTEEWHQRRQQSLQQRPGLPI